MDGYNIAFAIDGKTIAGRTEDNLTIAARVKESLTKDDRGNPQLEVTGHDVTFRASALARLSATGQLQQLTRDDLIEMSLAVGPSAKYPVTYSAEGGETYTGVVIITNFSESSNASDEANVSIDCRISGTLTPSSSSTESNS